MTISRGTFLKGASFTALAGLLAACSTGNGSSTSGSTTTASAEAGAFPITITSDYGDTVLKQAPTKIAVVNAWKNADALLALGVVPAGIPKVSWGQNSNDSTDWFDAKLKEMGKSLNDITRYAEADGPAYQELAKLAPDVIFAPYGNMSAEIYKKLSDIAPVVTAPKGVGMYEVSWQQVVEQAGKMLGTPSAATQLIDATTKELKEATSKYSNLAGASFIAGYFDVEKKTLGAYTAKDSRPQTFIDWGMVEAPYVTEHSKEAQSVFLSISSEVLDRVECDVLWAWVNDPADVEKIKSDPLLSALPALKKNAVIFESDKHLGLALSAASPLSLTWAVKNSSILEKFSTAIKNGKDSK